MLEYEKMLAEAAKNGAPMPPSIEPEVTKNSELLLKFTKEMLVPENMLEVLTQSQGSEESILSLELIPSDEEPGLSQLEDWTFDSADSKMIAVKLNFADPIEVSQGDEPDKLFIMARLQRYQDADGLSFPEAIFLEATLPK